jgi:DNA-binding GntR family transcriptional regulator
VDDHDPRVFMRIAADLRTRIESGEFGPGQPVSSITTICQEWGCARETASHALATLASEGYVRRYPGKGYYVLVRG